MIRSSTLFRLMILIPLTVGTVAGCRRAPDEARIREAIATMAQAAQTTDAGALADSLSEDFDGNHGQFDRRGFANVLRVLRLRGERVGVTLGPIAAEQRGDRWVMSMTVSLSRGVGVLPDRAGVYRVVSAWREEDGDWRCYSATWERAL